jgi:hypothetical protein
MNSSMQKNIYMKSFINEHIHPCRWIIITLNFMFQTQCSKFKLHAHLQAILFIQSWFNSNVFLGGSLVDIYAKSGNVLDVWSMFNKSNLKMWSIGMPYLEDVTHMGMVRNFLNTLDKCLKRCNIICHRSCLSFVNLHACKFGGWRHVLLCFNDHNLYDFHKIRVWRSNSKTKIY